MGQSGLLYRVIRRALLIGPFLLFALAANAQIQVELKLPRLQYISYEPVVATLGITNLAGRDIDLHDASGQPWFGFEVTGSDGQTMGSTTAENPAAGGPLKIEAGRKVTQRIDLTPL